MVVDDDNGDVGGTALSYVSDDDDDNGDISDGDDDEDADDGGALLSYVSDGRVFLSQDQQHTQMSCPLSCSNHPAPLLPLSS